MPGGPITVQVFDGILGKEITLPLVDGNYAVANFPARYSYVVPNPYGSDNPLPATGLPSTSTLLAFELTTVLDSVLGTQVTMQQIDAIAATQAFPSRYSWVSGAPVLPAPPPAPPAPLLNVNFSGSAHIISAPGANTSDGQASPVWNNAIGTSGSSGALQYSDGTNASGVSVAWTASTTTSFTTSPDLFSNFLKATVNAVKTLTVTGLVNNGHYVIYLYGQNFQSNQRGTTFSVTTGSGVPAPGFSTSTINDGFYEYPNGAFSPMGNYVVWNVQADNTGTVVISYTGNPFPNGNDEGDVSGLQLSLGTVPAVPAQHSLMGVNLSGMEFGGTNLPGVFGTDYTVPTDPELQYYASKGLTLIRLPVAWERLQHSLFSTLDAAYTGLIQTFVGQAAARGMQVVINIQNFGRYQISAGNVFIIGSAQVPYTAFSDLWSKLATVFKGVAGIYAYGLMNEPHNMGSNTIWPTAAQAAVNAIRAVDTGTLISVAGDGFSNSKHWYQNSATQNNSAYNIIDTSNNLMYEAHCYFDDAGYANDSTSTLPVSYTANQAYPDCGINQIAPFINWLKQNNFRGYVGEYAVPNNDPGYLTVLDNFLKVLKMNGIPGTYWGGGPWWGPYFIGCEPTAVPSGGTDAVQMAVIQNYPSS